MIIPISVTFMILGYLAAIVGAYVGISYLFNLVDNWIWGEK